MNEQKFIIGHILVIFILCTGLSNHVILIPLILNTGGRDAWMIILLTLIPAAIWLFFLKWIMRKMEQQKLFDWLEFNYNKTVSHLITFPIFIYLLLNFLITYRDTVTWLDVSYLEFTPNIIVAFVFALLILYMAKVGLRPIIFTSLVLLPIISIFGFFVASGNLNQKDHSLLFPLFEFGLDPYLRASIYIWGGLFEVFLILLVQHRIRDKIKYRHLLILIFILMGLTLGPTIGAITEFGPIEAMKQRYPAFEQWRLLNLGEYIDHLDVLSFFQWMTGAFVRLSVLLYLMAELYTSEKERSRIYLLVTFMGGLFLIERIHLSDMAFFSLLMHVFYPTVLIFSIVITIVMVALVYFKTRNKGGKASENYRQSL